tara:strand:+ start:452 stop:718 length:267 start_codon:yes stop_codon:yes gene_type:complete
MTNGAEPTKGKLLGAWILMLFVPHVGIDPHPDKNINKSPVNILIASSPRKGIPFHPTPAQISCALTVADSGLEFLFPIVSLDDLALCH